MNPAIINRMISPLLISLIIFTVVSSGGNSFGQDKDSINSKRLNTFLITTGVAYTASLVALNQLWYSDHPKESFHFFDDSGEWKQMDKIGHFYSTFHLSQAGSKGYRWTGMSQKKSALYGSIMGIALMLPIEFMDGYSSEYGASSSDILFNFLGAGFFLGQDLLWKEVRIHPKFSFSKSSIADYRPEVLGSNGQEQLIKDYNGQTYWLSFDFHSLAGFKPKWLNLALGYGVENMINASGNPTSEFPYESYRQYYLALDIDLTHIKSSSKAVNTLLYLVNLIHLPSPALEFNSQNKVIFHPLHF
jgi:uncharacterized protein YfiM (DUF2279 family)